MYSTWVFFTISNYASFHVIILADYAKLINNKCIMMHYSIMQGQSYDKVPLDKMLTAVSLPSLKVFANSGV